MGIQVEAGKRVTVSIEAIEPELRRIIRRGLPADRKAAGEILIHLRNVVGRSDHPDDLYSRIDALNHTLTEMVTGLDDEHLGPAARVLFATADGMRGTTLTTRRQHAASLLQYDSDHFRKHVERRILAQVAHALYHDLLRYRSRLRRSVTAYEVTRPTPTLRPDEWTPEDELVSRIWAELYHLRAERIAVRLAATDHERQAHRQVEEASALRLNDLCGQFTDTYGRAMIRSGDLEYAVEGLERLVVWRAT